MGFLAVDATGYLRGIDLGLGSGYFRENLVSLLCFLGRFGFIFYSYSS